MANLPEKNVVLVDKITNVPTDSNLFINANGEFKQASVNDVVNSSTVVSTAVETAINTAVQDSIDSNFKQTSGSPILLTDSAEGVLTDFKAYGKSIQDGEPTPDSPVDIKSVADGGYFDGELMQGYYDANGSITSYAGRVSSKNLIPCSEGNEINLIYQESVSSLIISYFKNGTYSSQISLNNVSEISGIVPSDVDSFGISVFNDGITPATAKPITVTINGKYALIVKSVGKNLLQNTATTQSINGVTFAVNEDKSVTVNGTSNAWVNILLGSIKMTSNLTLSSETVGTSNGNAKIQFYNATKSLQITELSNGSYDYNNSNGDTIEVWTRIAPSVTVSNLTFYPMIRPVGTDVTYEPYKETVSYIPLNEPLRSSLDGTVTDEVSLSENKVTRRIVRKRIVTVSKNNDTDVNNYCYYCALRNVGRSNGGISNNLPNLLLYEVTINGTENIGQYVSAEYGGVVYINVGKHLTENTVEGMTKWLSENPTYIQYELAEPITETIEPVDIVTYDNVTYLTASDNAEMELEYPTSKVAGIASIGYSKGRKAEYEVELLKAQLLELQTAMVNSL